MAKHKHHFARLLITLALVTADPLAEIRAELAALKAQVRELRADRNATDGAIAAKQLVRQ